MGDPTCKTYGRSYNSCDLYGLSYVWNIRMLLYNNCICELYKDNLTCDLCGGGVYG